MLRCFQIYEEQNEYILTDGAVYLTLSKMVVWLKYDWNLCQKYKTNQTYKKLNQGIRTIQT